MALFKRKTKDSVLPEVDQYYEAERRDRTGLAWLLALASILIVALILVGLFLGGRWAYNKITDDSSDAPETSDIAEAPSFDGTSDDTSGDEETKTPSANEGTVQAPVQTNTPSIPTTGDSSELPSTGPAHMVGIFAGVSTLAGGIHYAVQRRKLNR